ncbi:MAG: hypothetical protein AB8C84_10240 [Oligoflexales bacterium]
MIITIFFVSSNSVSASYTANRVWFEYHDGFYRVIVHYTVPELKELREATFDVVDKRKAEVFYFSLLRGAHFQLSSPDPIGFRSQEKKADPW